MKTFEAQCRCGNIELKITGEPVIQLYCHCDDCQAAHGAAYAPAAIFPSPAVTVVRGEPSSMVLKTTPRMRCGACGTYLFSEIAAVNVRSVSAYLLPKDEFKPQLHVQCQYAMLPIVDDLPHYKGFPPAFGGSEERVSW
jgi:hypothetical protein